MLNFTTSNLWIAGDLHGVSKDIAEIDQKAIRKNVDIIIQVGDFGVRWDWKADNYFRKRSQRNRIAPIWITVGGNHEKYSKLLEMKKEQNDPELVELWHNCYWAPRPTLIKINEEVFLLMGGANSTDMFVRVENKNWWKYEEPTKEEVGKFFYLLENEKPDIVVTHEAPASAHMYEDRKKTNVAKDLEMVVRLTSYMPRIWYYGHHHYSTTNRIGETDFICCGIAGEYTTHLEKKNV